MKARNGEMQIKSVHSDLDFLDIRQSPPEGQAGAFRIDVGLSSSASTRTDILGSMPIATSDPHVPEITVPVRGELR